jgi:hypothetical protein
MLQIMASVDMRSADNQSSLQQQPLNTMSCRPLVVIPMLALVLGVQARDQSGSRADPGARADSASRVEGGSHAQFQTQDASSRVRPVSDAEALQLEQMNRQKRRDVLREALRSQPEEASAAARQMSLQEKTELRQQLRQQQEWLK